ncbi:hypothetical protein GlitD10_2453 [Gloeomargarita lithophora Alchichica-D10]|uniref:Uncharacterized protein n=1 Tax=Gloeomargarita lithophora Alchichica-D10 TaxID=1188229 RepID=A0A1J0AFU2_9CYAN|nr:hypothetical protein [Gloeomargarita lithophora]APB34789.1 hypothetical protein GlitD10_2453 [Gloeomargarita lithophora Alchichica-D10]
MNPEETKQEQDESIAAEQSFLDEDNISQAKQRLYQILLGNPTDDQSRQLLRQICQKNSSSFGQNKQKFIETLEQEYQVIYEKTITLASVGWRYCLGLDSEYIDPSLQAISSAKKQEIKPEVVLEKAPYTAAQYLEQILSIGDIQSRWHYVNELVYAKNKELLADDFADIHDCELLDSLKSTLCGSKLNILIFGAGVVGLAFANALKTSLGELVNILMIENRIYTKHIKKPYTRNWLTNISNALYQDFFDPRVVAILREFGNGDYMGVPLNILETLLFLANRAQGTRFYFDDNFKLSLIKETDTDIVIDATGGKLNIIDANALDDGSFVVKLTAHPQFGSYYKGFGITNSSDMPAIGLTLSQKGSFFYPSLAGKQLKSAMVKLTDVPLELQESLLAQVTPNNSDGLIYIWPGKLRPELNSLLILINLSISDYHHLNQLLSQKTDLNSFIMQNSKKLELDPRILEFFQKILEYDVGNNSKIESPFLYEPRIHI